MKQKITYEQDVQDTLFELAKVQEKIELLVNQFYIDHDKADLFQIIDLIIEKGNPKNREFLTSFKGKFEIGELELCDIKHYQDLYDQHKMVLVKGGNKDV